MIVLDTTVLVYAKGSNHAFRAPCRQLIAAIAEESLEATTTAEAIQEFVHVRARRRDRADAAALGRDYADLLAPLLAPTDRELRHGLDLFEEHSDLGAFDAVLAAAALDAGADSVVSADQAFSRITDLRHVIPDETGVADLLGN